MSNSVCVILILYAILNKYLEGSQPEISWVNELGAHFLNGITHRVKGINVEVDST